jgi:hypothetical protein
MKRNLFLILVNFLIFAMVPGIPSYGQKTSPEGKKITHVKTVTIKDGKETVVDTTFTGENVKVFKHEGGKSFVWVTSGDSLKTDTLTEDFEFIPGVGKGKRMVIMRHGRNEGPVIIREMETEGDSGKKVVVHVENISPEEGDILIHRRGAGRQGRLSVAPMLPGVPMPPARALRIQKNRNVIDLADPGIISYKKQKLSGGREKITIIRNEVKETNEETFNIQLDSQSEDLKKMNAPRRVNELEIQKKDLGHPINIEKKVEIKTK